MTGVGGCSIWGDVNAHVKHDGKISYTYLLKFSRFSLQLMRLVVLVVGIFPTFSIILLIFYRSTLI